MRKRQSYQLPYLPRHFTSNRYKTLLIRMTSFFFLDCFNSNNCHFLVDTLLIRFTLFSCVRSSDLRIPSSWIQRRASARWLSEWPKNVRAGEYARAGQQQSKLPRTEAPSCLSVFTSGSERTSYIQPASPFKLCNHTRCMLKVITIMFLSYLYTEYSRK